MNDVITNQLASYRSRLAKLDEPQNKAIWENQAPLIFTTKVEEARTLTDELAEMGSRQSAPTVGSTADKRREELELEDEAYKVARALVVYARDAGNETLAAKYDLPISSWRRMRGEALLERARLLETEAGAITTGADTATAEQYGVSVQAVADLKKEADDYETYIVAPKNAIGDRSVLTATLPDKSRETRAKFDELENFLPQFAGTPAGDFFIATFLASTQIIDAGHGPGTGGGNVGGGSSNGGNSSGTPSSDASSDSSDASSDGSSSGMSSDSSGSSSSSYNSSSSGSSSSSI